MDECIKETFKTVLRKHVDLRRVTALYLGNETNARILVSAALREIADEIEK